MVFKTLFSVVAAAVLAPSLATTIKLNRECTKSPKNCANGLICVGKPNLKRCVLPKVAGMQCRIEPFWVCRSDLVCEDKVCKIPEGGNCSNDRNQCADGLECTGSGNRRTCTEPAPEPAMLGEDCNNRNMKCDRGLVCDGGECKLARGQTCTRNRNACSGDLACDGKGAQKRCIVLKEAGMGCPAREAFWICRPELVCQANRCKIPVGSSCASSPNNCVAGAQCNGSGRARRCVNAARTTTAPVTQAPQTTQRTQAMQATQATQATQPAQSTPALGEACNNTNRRCFRRQTCDDGVCKLNRNQVCTKTPDACSGDLACDGKKAVKRCIVLKVAGMRCPSRENFWICEPGLVCQNDVCKIPEGASCASSPANCASGTACTGSGASRKCTKKH